MNPFVSVIVTTKNNEKIIERCLESVRQQSYPRVELIVVDNFSTDRTAEIARRYTKKVFSKGPERSAQRNFGVSHAKGQFLFVIDSDMELSPGVIKDCVTSFDGHVALVIPETFVGEGFWARCKILEKSCYSGTSEGVAVRFFRRDTFLALGGYDEHLTGPEDIDFHKRITDRGTYTFTSSPIIHYDGRLTLSSIIRKRYYYSLTLRRYLCKHPVTSRKEFTFFRPVYFRQWRLLLRDPLHLLGMLVLRVFEGAAVLLALWKTRKQHIIPD